MMTDTETDHVAEALRSLREIASDYDAALRNMDITQAALTAGQVHATLALADEVRELREVLIHPQAIVPKRADTEGQG